MNRGQTLLAGILFDISVGGLTLSPLHLCQTGNDSMTDEQLNQRFTQIAQAFEFLLHDMEALKTTHTAEMAEIRKAQVEFADNDRKLQARIEAIVEATNKNSEEIARNSEEIARLTREWTAYLRTRPPQ
jgi:hypothetical protein